MSLPTIPLSQRLPSAGQPSPISLPTHLKSKENDPMAIEKPFTPSPTISPVLVPLHINRVPDPILPVRNHVLLVEDNEINLKVWQHIFAYRGLLLSDWHPTNADYSSWSCICANSISRIELLSTGWRLSSSTKSTTPRSGLLSLVRILLLLILKFQPSHSHPCIASSRLLFTSNPLCTKN